MVQKSPAFATLGQIFDLLIRPLNEKNMRSFGRSFLEIYPDIDFVRIKCKFLGCPVTYRFIRCRKSDDKNETAYLKYLDTSNKYHSAVAHEADIRRE